VLLPDGTRQDSVHTDTADVARAVVPGRAGPWDANEPRKVDWAVGCAIAGRTETLRRLGPFDEGVFMYAEDLDLGLRAAQQGIASVCCWGAAPACGSTAEAAMSFDPSETRVRKPGLSAYSRV